MHNSSLALLIFSLCMSPAMPCIASPLDDHIVGVSGVPPYTQGVDAELRLTGTPFSLGGQVNYYWDPKASSWSPFSPQLNSHNQWTFWGKFETLFKANTTIGLVVGVSQTWDGLASSDSTSTGTGSSIGSTLGVVVGASATRTIGKLWLRSTPNFQIIVSDTSPNIGPSAFLLKTLFSSGIPWFEAGYELMPGLDVSLLTNLTPVRLSWRF